MKPNLIQIYIVYYIKVRSSNMTVKHAVGSHLNKSGKDFNLTFSLRQHLDHTI